MLHKEIKENRKQRSLSQNYTYFTSFFRNVEAFLKDGPTLQPQMHKFFYQVYFHDIKCVCPLSQPISAVQFSFGVFLSWS